MAEKRTMTLNLTDSEMAILEELAESKDLTKTAVIRQAIRLFQLVEHRIANGEKLFFENKKKKTSELMVL